MLNRWIVSSCLFVLGASLAVGQAKPTALRQADLQVGVGFVDANSDYTVRLKGFAVYSTLDLNNHLGGEIEFHQANTSTGNQLYEQTYEIGPRYHRTYGPVEPYIKGMYGRGRFNFPNSVALIAYNIFALGGGFDLKVLPYLNVRVEYEYQNWRNFPPQGLTPELITIGVAYHVPGGLKRGLHWK